MSRSRSVTSSSLSIESVSSKSGRKIINSSCSRESIISISRRSISGSSLSSKRGRSIVSSSLSKKKVLEVKVVVNFKQLEVYNKNIYSEYY